VWDFASFGEHLTTLSGSTLRGSEKLVDDHGEFRGRCLERGTDDEEFFAPRVTMQHLPASRST